LIIVQNEKQEEGVRVRKKEVGTYKMRFALGSCLCLALVAVASGATFNICTQANGPAEDGETCVAASPESYQAALVRVKEGTGTVRMKIDGVKTKAGETTQIVLKCKPYSDDMTCGNPCNLDLEFLGDAEHYFYMRNSCHIGSVNYARESPFVVALKEGQGKDLQCPPGTLVAGGVLVSIAVELCTTIGFPRQILEDAAEFPCGRDLPQFRDPVSAGKWIQGKPLSSEYNFGVSAALIGLFTSHASMYMRYGFLPFAADDEDPLCAARRAWCDAVDKASGEEGRALAAKYKTLASEAAAKDTSVDQQRALCTKMLREPESVVKRMEELVGWGAISDSVGTAVRSGGSVVQECPRDGAHAALPLSGDPWSRPAYLSYCGKPCGEGAVCASAEERCCTDSAGRGTCVHESMGNCGERKLGFVDHNRAGDVYARNALAAGNRAGLRANGN
jgi:hypothetical protein